MSAETESGRRKRRLGKKQQATLAAKLLVMQKELLPNVDKAVSSANQTGDSCDSAQQETFVQMDLSMTQKGRDKLRKIRESFARMDGGEYGICQECEEPIAFKRLQSEPTATLCIECKLEQEALQKRLGVTARAYAPV